MVHAARARLDRTLAALAHPTRRALLEALSRGPARASELAERLDASRPALSRHLRVLEESGLIRLTGLPEDGRVRMVCLEPAPMRELSDWLDEVSAFWGEQLSAFKAYAEARAKKGKA